MAPDKPLTIATYAVSASVAAIVLGYIFGPTFFPTDGAFGSSRKRSAVGLSNPANDCFINSVLQAFAGLRPLREYLARESALHEPEPREDHDDSSDNETTPAQKQHEQTQPPSRALEDEIVTRALSLKLAALNEAPTHKKTLSAGDFVRVLEFAFGARISRKQQDAQEFLHLVAERLCEEHHALRRKRAANDEKPRDDADVDARTSTEPDIRFPFEGCVESRIECRTCRFTPRANASSFVTLTLNVPQETPATSLDACLDGLLKAELIDDYKCDRCRVHAALDACAKRLSADPAAREREQDEEQQLRAALADPEAACASPTTIPLLGPPAAAPRRQIAKHTTIARHPPLLALHLSRSVFAVGGGSRKNSARVEFPEVLVLHIGGGVLAAAAAAQRRGGSAPARLRYRLACVVTHRGGHDSGHYETYRRQSATAPKAGEGEAGSTVEENWKQSDGGGSSSRKRREVDSWWWCISDDKVRACRTRDVLAKQKEVYLLFYELVSAPG